MPDKYDRVLADRLVLQFQTPLRPTRSDPVVPPAALADWCEVGCIPRTAESPRSGQWNLARSVVQTHLQTHPPCRLDPAALAMKLHIFQKSSTHIVPPAQLRSRDERRTAFVKGERDVWRLTTNPNSCFDFEPELMRHGRCFSTPIVLASGRMSLG